MLLDERIEKSEIVLKYTTRWDIEICIREIKTLMDINVLRAKSPDMLRKELTASLIAYNFVRYIIAKSVENTDFSPQRDIFYLFDYFSLFYRINKYYCCAVISAHV